MLCGDAVSSVSGNRIQQEANVLHELMCPLKTKSYNLKINKADFEILNCMMTKC